MNTSDLATFSKRPARSANTAITRPMTDEATVTVSIHHSVLEKVPRITEKTAKANTNRPSRIGPTEPPVRSSPITPLRVRWIVIPIRRPEATKTRPTQNSWLVKRSVQFEASTKFWLPNSER